MRVDKPMCPPGVHLGRDLRPTCVEAPRQPNWSRSASPTRHWTVRTELVTCSHLGWHYGMSRSRCLGRPRWEGERSSDGFVPAP
jgi:hypothetical protein